MKVGKFRILTSRKSGKFDFHSPTLFKFVVLARAIFSAKKIKSQKRKAQGNERDQGLRALLLTLCNGLGAINMNGGGGERGKGKSKATAIEIVDSDTEGESPVAVAPKVAEPRDEKSNVVNTLAALVGDRAQMERERLDRQKKRQREAGTEDEDGAIQPSMHKKVVTASIKETSASAHVFSPTLHSSTSISKAKTKLSETPLYYSGTIKVRE